MTSGNVAILFKTFKTIFTAVYNAFLICYCDVRMAHKQQKACSAKYWRRNLLFFQLPTFTVDNENLARNLSQFFSQDCICLCLI